MQHLHTLAISKNKTDHKSDKVLQHYITESGDNLNTHPGVNQDFLSHANQINKLRSTTRNIISYQENVAAMTCKHILQLSLPLPAGFILRKKSAC